MTDEPSDVGAASPQRASAPSRPQPPSVVDLAADKAARDAEFSVFYQQNLPRLVTFLVVQGAGHHAADIAQEVMTEAYRNWEALDRPGAWVRRVAERQWWKLAPRSRAEIPHDDLPEPSGLLTPAAYEQIENQHVLLAQLAGLTNLQRQVLAWSYDGYHPTEIAAVLGKNPTTVRSALHEARKKVQSSYLSGEETP